MVDALSIDGSGGSVGRAVAHFSDSNVGVHLRRTLCAVMVERIVRIFILAARMFHSQFQIVFSSAESGRLSGQADLPICRSERQRSPAAHLVRRTVRRLVRRIHLAVWLFHFPFIPESVLPLYLCVALSRSVHFSFRTSAFRFGEAL